MITQSKSHLSLVLKTAPAFSSKIFNNSNLRDIINAKEIREKVCCIIDDDPSKAGRYLESIPIVGGRDNIMAATQKYNISKIYVAMPSASASRVRSSALPTTTAS